MKKWYIWLGVIVVVIIGLFVFAYLSSLPEPEIKNSVPTPTIPVNYSNFAQVISKTSIVKDIPSGANILLKFYNVKDGEKQFEKSYIITKGNIVEGTGDAEITFTLSASYLSELTNKNFCTIIQKARNNGDLGIETSLSTIQLGWKYSSMLKDRGCLGL